MTATPSSLYEIGSRFGSDKFTLHGFDSIYERFMQPLRDQPITLLEIGIGGENHEAGGPSLKTWRDYFPHGQIHGIDIYDKSALDSPRLKTHVCSQNDVNALGNLCQSLGPLDFIIDDGSHKGPDVAIALFTLFPYLRPGGIYFIEDIQTSYWPQYQGSSLVSGCHDTATRWLKSSIDLINRHEILDPDVFPVHANIDIAELHVFHNIAALVRRPDNVRLESRTLTDDMRRDFLAIDKSMHGNIAAIHDLLMRDPAKMRALLSKVEALGGLDVFLGGTMPG